MKSLTQTKFKKLKSQFHTQKVWTVYNCATAEYFQCGFKPTKTELRRLCTEEWWQYDFATEETITLNMLDIDLYKSVSYQRKAKK